MAWNFDITQAPRGTTETITTLRDGKPVSREVFRPAKIIAADRSGAVVTVSYWMPSESRWCMFAQGEEPFAWMPWPDHPGVPE